MKYYVEFWKRAFDFKGVASRAQYWFSLLANIVVTFVIFLILAFVIHDEEVYSLITGLYTIALLVPSISISVRRLHDQNKSGWLYLISLIPAIGSIIIFIFMLLGTVKENNPWRVFDIQRGYIKDDIFTEPLAQESGWTYKER